MSLEPSKGTLWPALQPVEHQGEVQPGQGGARPGVNTGAPAGLVEEVEGQGEASQEVTGRESQEAGEVGLATVL